MFLKNFHPLVPSHLCLMVSPWKLLPEFTLKSEESEQNREPLQFHSQAFYKVYLVDDQDKYFNLDLLADWGIKMYYTPNINTFVSN